MTRMDGVTLLAAGTSPIVAGIARAQAAAELRRARMRLCVALCCNAECKWVGEPCETVTPPHDAQHLLCPQCHEVIEIDLP